jgi:hemoglobin/transferrin/lactoferrin receptor protein
LASGGGYGFRSLANARGGLRVLGALCEDGYHLSGGGVSSGGTHLSPKLTIGITPIRGIEFYGAYAQGYRAPSVTEPLIEGVHPTPSFTFLPTQTSSPRLPTTGKRAST